MACHLKLHNFEEEIPNNPNYQPELNSYSESLKHVQYLLRHPRKPRLVRGSNVEAPSSPCPHPRPQMLRRTTSGRAPDASRNFWKPKGSWTKTARSTLKKGSNSCQACGEQRPKTKQRQPEPRSLESKLACSGLF